MKQTVFDLVDGDIHPFITRIDSAVRTIVVENTGHKDHASIVYWMQDKVWDVLDGGDIHERLIGDWERVKA